MRDLLIREFISEDESAVEQCIFELQEDEWSRDPTYWNHPNETKGKYLDYLLQTLEKMEGKIFVAENDGEVIGFVVVVLSDREDSPSIALERFGYIMDLVVQRKYHKRGYGKVLMDKAEEFVMSKGIQWMHLDVSKNNPAESFYLKSGYRQKSSRFEKKLNL